MLVGEMQKEPLWRQVLCWGVVATYLCFPLVIFLIGLNGSPEIVQRVAKFHFLREFYFSITGILVSLAGLNTYQITRNGNGKEICNTTKRLEK